MRSINLLKTIIRTPFIFRTEEELQAAKDNLVAKIRRRDRKILKRTQFALFDETIFGVLTSLKIKNVKVEVITAAMIRMERKPQTTEKLNSILNIETSSKLRAVLRRLCGADLIRLRVLKSGTQKWSLTKRGKKLILGYK